MVEVNLNYSLKEDLIFLTEAEKIPFSELSKKTGVSRTTIDGIIKNGTARDEVCEKIYAYAYENKYRLNAVKEELSKERYGSVLFHGSKEGLSQITSDGARENCDFGKGFYLGETYHQAVSFVCEKEKSSVYSFRYSLSNLQTKSFECNLEWMLAICYYRGRLQEYASSALIQRIVAETEAADVIVAPIADNKMFYIMTQFTDGDINADVALHSLSASKLGLQYVFKTEKALKQLTPLERFYLSVPERKDCSRELVERGFEIDTKLKLAKREYKTGLYIEEILK